MEVLSGEELHRLSYVELRQYAKKHGIKANLKAEKLITAILSRSGNTRGVLESFADDDIEDTLYDQSQVAQEVTNDAGASSRRSVRRFTRVLAVGNASDVTEQSQVPDDVRDDENGSKRSSRRLTRTMAVENSPKVTEENKSWSEDSEIELKTPVRSFRRAGTFCVEVPVTPMENQPKLDAVLAEPQRHKQRRSTSVSFSVSDITAKNQAVSCKKDNRTISEDKTYIISGPQPAFTPAKTRAKSILRVSKKHCSVEKGSQSPQNSKRSQSNGNKVNFLTPDKKFLRRSSSTSKTSLRSVKDRPKTPLAVRSSVKRKRAFSPSVENSPKMLRTAAAHSTPKLTKSASKETKTFSFAVTKSDKSLQTDTPVTKSIERKQAAAVTRIFSTRKEMVTLSMSQKKRTDAEASKIQTPRKEMVTPSMSQKKRTAAEASKIQTPNFTLIHQKAFEKMEALPEYEERRKNRLHVLTRSQNKSRAANVSSQQQLSSGKQSLRKTPELGSSVKPSRIPQPFRGIPFIPVVKSIRKITTNFADQAKPQSFLHSTSKMANKKGNWNSSKNCQRSLFTSASTTNVFQFGNKQVKENDASIAKEKVSKRKFDLKASLAKKLPYQPHRGALRPLADANSNKSQINYSGMDPIKQKREKSREILKGVRKNRRFELQMSRRGIA